MKIELKNIKFLESMSEETNCFTADIFVEGKKVGFAKNHGHGGSTDYQPLYDERELKFRENKEAMAKAEVYCKSLPDIDCGTFKIESNLEHVIDDLFEKWLKEKDEKKFQKKMEKSFLTGIVVGVPNSGKYGIFDLKKPLTVYPAHALQKFINEKIKPQLKEGEVILNTNLEKMGIKI